MKIIENIRMLRTARGLTQEQMAARLQMDVANYSRIERGISKLTVERMEEIARILNIKTADLLQLNLSGSTENADNQVRLIEKNNLLLETILNEIKELNERSNRGIVTKMKEWLQRSGYFRLRHCTDELLNTMLSELGTVIYTTDVMVRPESSFLVTSAKGLDYHTDHHKAKYIVWHCIRQTDKGGESILIDAKKVYEKLSEEHKKALHEIQLYEHKVFPDDEDNYPFVESRDGEVNFYYSFWLVKKEDKAHPALMAFQDMLREAKPVKILLKPGDVLVIDNHRMLHGRTPIEGNRDRYLKRFWIAPKNNLFLNHKNQ